MRTRILVHVSMALIALTIVASPALAQSSAEQSTQPSRTSLVELTPFASMGSLGSSRVGTAISFPVSSKVSVEAELGYRRGEGRINAFSSNVNVLYTLPRLGRIVPYVAGGAGLEEYGAPIALAEGSEIFTQPKLRFAINAGGGLKVPLDDTWAFRTDARWFKSFGRNGSEHWRVYQGASVRVGKRTHD